MHTTRSKDLEVALRHEGEKAVIEGKTGVPFETFVTLVLQRKVFSLFRQWGKAPVIIESELLTSLASAPQDNTENRTHLVLVTFGVGIVTGVFCSVIGLAILQGMGIALDIKELLLIAGALLLTGLVVGMMGRLQRRKSHGEKLAEHMEKLAAFLSK